MSTCCQCSYSGTVNVDLIPFKREEDSESKAYCLNCLLKLETSSYEESQRKSLAIATSPLAILTMY